MRPYRNLKIGSLLQTELGRIFLREFDFEDALVTITGVEISGDLLQAKVSLGVIPKEQGINVIEIIEKRKRKLGRLLLRKMNIKPMPRLEFYLTE